MAVVRSNWTPDLCYHQHPDGLQIKALVHVQNVRGNIKKDLRSSLQANRSVCVSPGSRVTMEDSRHSHQEQ